MAMTSFFYLSWLDEATVPAAPQHRFAVVGQDTGFVISYALAAGPRSGPVGAAFVLRKDAVRLLLEPRWNEQFGRAHRVRGVGAHSSQLDGDALRLEPALRDLRLDPR
jgi:hypothetical protein